MRLEQMVLTFVEIPLVTPFGTSYGQQSVKTGWIVSVQSGGITGYAESVASLVPLYTEETHASVYFALKNDLMPRLWGQEIAHPEEVEARLAPVRGNRMAKAVIEMAFWDWFARRDNRPLRDLLGGDLSRRRVQVGVAIGIKPDTAQLVEDALRYVDQGYRRIKIKIRPGYDVEPLAALRRALGDQVAIMADANSAYRLEDLPLLQSLDPLNLLMLEQPLDPDDYVDHRILGKALSTPICLDESIRSDQDARKAIELGACRVINVKPGRVGGHAVARRIHQVAESAGVPVWCGGMLETGIGRAHNLHLSTLPCFTLPGDISASDRYFHEDIIQEPFRLNPDGTLTVPTGPGIGVLPDIDRLRAVSTFQETWRSSALPIRGGVPYHDGTSF